MKNKIWIYFILSVGNFYAFDSQAQTLDKGFYRITNQAIGEGLPYVWKHRIRSR